MDRDNKLILVANAINYACMDRFGNKWSNEDAKLFANVAIITYEKLNTNEKLMTFNEAVVKCCQANPNSGKEDGEAFVKGLVAVGLLNLKTIEIVDSPRPVDRDHLKRDFNVYLADLKNNVAKLIYSTNIAEIISAINGLEKCIREL